MKLREWRESRGLSLEALVAPTGCKSATVVSRWERGVQIPRKKQMTNIYVLTAGAVDANSFYELPPLPAPQDQQVAA